MGLLQTSRSISVYDPYYSTDTHRTVITDSIQMRSIHIFLFHLLFLGATTHRLSRFPTSSINNCKSIVCKIKSKMRQYFFQNVCGYSIIVVIPSNIIRCSFTRLSYRYVREPDQMRKSDKTFSHEICQFYTYTYKTEH